MLAGGLLAKGALAADRHNAAEATIAKAVFFAHTMIPEAVSLRAVVEGATAAVGAGATSLLRGD